MTISQRAAAILSGLLFAVAPAAQAQTTIRVPLDQPTIQAAINAAANGDTVLVSPGTYVENINFAGKAITVTSEAGPEVTRIDGGRNGSVVTFGSGEGRASLISGFTLANGQAPHGGGISVLLASPSIVGNIIVNNFATQGPGIRAVASNLLLRNNTIVNNQVWGGSGGIGGGGIQLEGGDSAQIVDNLITGNRSGASGGGISVWAAASPVISGNIIERNRAAAFSDGGGIWIAYPTQALIAQNVIVGNLASSGGGISWVLPSSLGQAGLLILNNTIAHNEAADGSGIDANAFDHPVVLHNNLVIGTVHCVNQPPSFRFNNVFSGGAAPYSGTCGNPTGIDGNISAEPVFADPANGDYRLQLASPALDAADNAAPQILPRDADGNPRIVDGDGNASNAIDMGAYERGALLAPAFHHFGHLQVGSAPAAMTFAITNPGAALLSISSIGVTGRAVGAGGPADFSVAAGGPQPCESLAPTLQSGQTCTVVVTFTPPAVLGSKGATLRVESNDAASPAVAALLANVLIETAITSGPSPRTIHGSAVFTFTSDIPGILFECRLGTQGAFAACASPASYTLAMGTHTFQVRAISEFGDPDPTPASYTVTVSARAKRADFDGDARADILWRNGATGENYLWPMDGISILATEGYVRTVADQDWVVAGSGDFDGDGRADVLWRNVRTGENYIYFMDGPNIRPGEGYIRTVANLDWTVAGVGDFDGDGQADILWRNQVSGENYLYPMNGLTIKSGEGYLTTVPNLDWRIAGVADLDGDGKSDILWRNANSGELYLYPMDGRAVKSTEGFIRTVSDSSWQIRGLGDFNGDGRADILWRNSATGENYLFPMMGKLILFSEGHIRPVSNLDWQIAAVGDYDGDGKADILWRNATTGENYLYPMNGFVIKPSEGYLRSVPPGAWTIVGK